MARDPDAYKVDGKRVPSVTEVLKLGGWVNYDGVDPEVLARAARRGTFVHEASERLDDGTLDWSTIPTEWVGYVEAYERWRDKADFQVVASEEIVINSKYRYAGQLDRRGTVKGVPVIFDLKTSYAPSPSWGPQLSGYAECFEEPHARAVLWLRRDGTFQVIKYTDPDDRRLFLATAFLVNGLIDRGVLVPPWAEDAAKEG